MDVVRFAPQGAHYHAGCCLYEDKEAEFIYKKTNRKSINDNARLGLPSHETWPCVRMQSHLWDYFFDKLFAHHEFFIAKVYVVLTRHGYWQPRDVAR